MLKFLREIKPEEVLPEEPPNNLQALTTKRIQLEQQVRVFEEAEGESEEAVRDLVNSIRNAKAKLRAARAAEDEERARIANPKSAAWAEVKSLLNLAQDERSRSRLRTRLGDILDKVWVLIVRHKVRKLAAVRMHFKDGRNPRLPDPLPGRGEPSQGRLGGMVLAPIGERTGCRLPGRLARQGVRAIHGELPALPLADNQIGQVPRQCCRGGFTSSRVR